MPRRKSLETGRESRSNACYSHCWPQRAATQAIRHPGATNLVVDALLQAGRARRGPGHRPCLYASLTSVHSSLLSLSHLERILSLTETDAPPIPVLVRTGRAMAAGPAGAILLSTVSPTGSPERTSQPRLHRLSPGRGSRPPQELVNAIAGPKGAIYYLLCVQEHRACCRLHGSSPACPWAAAHHALQTHLALGTRQSLLVRVFWCPLQRPRPPWAGILLPFGPHRATRRIHPVPSLGPCSTEGLPASVQASFSPKSPEAVLVPVVYKKGVHSKREAKRGSRNVFPTTTKAIPHNALVQELLSAGRCALVSCARL